MKWYPAVLLLICLSCGQDSRERGNTDITNNRTRGAENTADNNAPDDRSTVTKIIEQLPGTWQLEKIIREKNAGRETDTIGDERTIRFTRENRYLSQAGGQAIDSGMFRVNEQQGRLYMTSEDGEQTTEWLMEFDQDGNMILKSQQEQSEFVYSRQGDNDNESAGG